MPKHIGIVACSAEGAALCYRTICSEAKACMGEHAHPEISMHTHCLAEYMKGIVRGDWQQVANLMLDSSRKLASIGAEFLICPDNTIHQSLPLVEPDSPLPWLHIAKNIGEHARAAGMKRLAITGTKYLMTGPVYPEALQRCGIACEIPDAAAREEIDRIIFSQLVYGDIREPARLYFNEVIAGLRDRGCDGVVLGCTEIPLLVRPEDCPLPCLDSTRLLARAALAFATA